MDSAFAERQNGGRGGRGLKGLRGLMRNKIKVGVQGKIKVGVQDFEPLPLFYIE